MHERKVTFNPPEGSVPEGTAQGDMFDLVCTFQLESGGKVCLTQMGDHKMPGYGERSAKEERPSYKPLAQDMAASAPQGPPMGGGGGGGGYG